MSERIAAIFEPLSFKSTASAFRGGTVELWYGGGIIDLRGATLAPEGAVITVKAIFGGCQIVVPASWNVVTHVRGVGGAATLLCNRYRVGPPAGLMFTFAAAVASALPATAT